jgi:hypothetical protein
MTESELSYRGIRASIYNATSAQNIIGDLEFFRNVIAAILWSQQRIKIYLSLLLEHGIRTS